ncbi:YdcF family protein [Halosolutus gelatinilyticus]|uniref:YdcF family protein n=1 Tax=Halosolutus gelatinilyticus TaxID=2931975 RepID=UPI001FF42771|nr:YdcF family protein [Halosolutus gelatinilyticus]
MVVVVLGHRLSKNGIHPELRDRVDAGITTFQQTNAPFLVCSGGRTNDAVPRTESEVMREYAIERGIDRSRILLENRSLDTIGNAYFARLLVDELADDPETIAVVTSAYHADRAAYIFEQCFGDDYRIDTSYAVETPPSGSHGRAREARRLERARTFFEAIQPGDVDAIRRRLAEAHDYYEIEATVPTR